MIAARQDACTGGGVMRPRLVLPVAFLLLLALMALAALPARAQYLFGKNKVLYNTREWLVSRGERVELFFYPEERHLARLALAMADSAVIELESVFDVAMDEPVPIILYGSKLEFRETNVLPSLIPESTEGFTDLIRGRVVVPSTGSMSMLRHVVRHELVHAVMLHKLARVMGDRRQYSYQHPPLWFVEGLAEFYSVGAPDAEGEMLLREGILENRLPPLTDMWSIRGTYLMYKMGQSLVAFLDRNYGTEAVRGILESWWRSDDFGKVLQLNLGMDLPELDRRWRSAMRRRYYPTVHVRAPARERGRELFESPGFQAGPAAVNDSTFVYLETRSGWVDLSLADLPRDPRRPARGRPVVRGGRGPGVEYIPFFRSRPSARDGWAVLTSPSGPRDALLFVDLDTGHVVRRFVADSLVQVEAPSLGPDGRVLFSGITPDGRRDLYLLAGDWRREDPGWRLTRLTDDDCDDREPSWHPSGERFVFSSDRGHGHASPHRNLFEMDPATGAMRRLTRGDWTDRQPAWHPDGRRYLYVSDRRGAWDVYLAEGDVHRRQTASYGGVQDPAWIGEDFLASVYRRGTYRLYHFALRPDGDATVQAPEPDGSARVAVAAAPAAELPRPVPYTRRWGLDFVQSGMAYDPEFGSAAGGMVGFTDLLGNHQVLVAASNTAQSSDDFFKRMNVGVSYNNLSRRWNWGVTLFHLSSDYDPNWELYRHERRIGGLLGLRYPFNLFQRLELSLTVRAVLQDEDFELSLRRPDATLASFYAALVHDTVLWGYGGPFDGERVNLTLGWTEDFGEDGYGYAITRLDARKYWRLSRLSVFAARLVGHYSFGDDPRFYHLGGPLELRGWPYRYFHSRGVLLSNNEVRFPVLHGLRFYSPFGNLDLPAIRGSLFFDAARLFYHPYSRPEGRWVGDFGAGLELGFGPPIVIRWNMTRRTDFESVDRDTEHQVFLGWNF